MGARSLEAQCGTLSVPENPAQPKGRKIALNIAWIPADESGDHDPDPVFLIAGGPGQSATESFAGDRSRRSATSRKNRDMILVDQRGTGKSNPLQCKFDDEDKASPDAVDASAADATNRRKPRARWRSSAATSSRARPTCASTRRPMRCAISTPVREAIGAQKINLMGVSYGTRVAQQYAMRYPQHTRTIVLDSVAPNAIYLGNDFARNLESALDLQFGQCAKTPGCTKALGDPRERLNALMVKLRAESPLVKYRDASDGRDEGRAPASRRTSRAWRACTRTRRSPRRSCRCC